MNAPLSTEEQVRVTGDDPAAVLILNAMATFIDDDDFMEKFGGGPVVPVVLTVNGQQVPVVATLVDAWKRTEAVLEERARKMAIRMVTDAGLEPLAQVLRDAEQKIREKLGIWDDAHE